MTTRLCVYIFAFGLTLAAVASAEISPEESFAEATSFVQAFVAEHATEGGDSACRKVADDSIKTIETECKALQKNVDEAAKANQACCTSGKISVCAAAKAKGKASGKKSTCDDEAKAIESAKISFSTDLNSLKGGKCNGIHGSSAYKRKKAKYSKKTTECNKLSGAAKQAKKTLNKAIKAAAKSRGSCNKNAKKKLKAAIKNAKKACNSDKNRRAFTRATHMKCVLDGKTLKECDKGNNRLLQPGSIVALWNPRQKRFTRMPNGDKLDKSGERKDATLPKDWSWERFKVVDAGNGEIGLWNPRQKRFMRMPNGDKLDKSGERNDATLPKDWSWERFKPVDAGNGEIGLWNPRQKRFMRMPNGDKLDKSGERKDGTMPKDWSWERFKVVVAKASTQTLSGAPAVTGTKMSKLTCAATTEKSC